jgi:acetolactate synthase-1/3 small subunit
VERELILAKISCAAKDKVRLERLLHKYVAKLIQYKSNSAIIEAVGDREQIRQLLEDLQAFEIKELVRSGRLALAE